MVQGRQVSGTCWDPGIPDPGTCDGPRSRDPEACTNHGIIFPGPAGPAGAQCTSPTPRRGRAGLPGSGTRERPGKLYQDWYKAGYTRIGTIHVLPAGTCWTPRIRHQRGPESYTKIGTSPGVDMQHGRAGPGSAPARPRRAARPLSCQHPEARTHPAYPLGQVRPPRLEHL